MAESAASAAFHSFFTSAGRTASAPHSSLQCALRAIATHRPTAAATATPALSLRALGKQRAEEPPSLEEECRRWLSEVAMNQQIFALAHSFWCSDRDRLFEWREVSETRTSVFRRAVTSLLSSVRTSQNSSPLYALLRRASSLAQPSTAVSVQLPDFSTHIHPDHLLSYAFDPGEAWSAYILARELGGLRAFSGDQLLSFAEQLVTLAERLKPYKARAHRRLWGMRTVDLLQDLRHRRAIDHDSIRVKCLEARIWVLRGNDVSASVLLRKQRNGQWADPEKSELLLQVYHSLLLSTWRRAGAGAVVRLICRHWRRVSHHTQLPQSPDETMVQTAFRKTLSDLLGGKMGSPVGLLAMANTCDPLRRVPFAVLLIEIACSLSHTQDVLGVRDALHAMGSKLPRSTDLYIVRSLASQGDFSHADQLFAPFVDSPPHPVSERARYIDTLNTGLYLYSRKGDSEKAEHYFALLSQASAKLPGTSAKADLMHAYAVDGNVGKTRSLFDNFFPISKRGKTRHNSPQTIHYTTVLLAHSRAGDSEGLRRWMNTMVTDGVPVDAHVYGILVHGFAARGDAATVDQILNEMRLSGISPTVKIYTSVIALFANQQNARAAEALYRRALKERITPDHHMVAALMNVYAESGTWAGVVRAYDYLKASQLPITIDVCNTLLKAYVLAGAPFNIVADVFGHLGAIDIAPDAHTFALLIQSACDNGRMDTAHNIIHEMDRLAQDPESGIEVNAYVLTILMGGHLRRGDTTKARAVYEDMRHRGIQPTSVTFAVMLQQFVLEGANTGLLLGKQFVDELTQDEERMSRLAGQAGGRASALEHIHAPIMDKLAARRDSITEVERLAAVMSRDSKPSLEALTFLLKAYRETGDADGVRKTWLQIIDLRRQRAPAQLLSTGAGGQPRLLADPALCVALSVYVDAMSAAGEHEEVLRAWEGHATAGFAYNLNNWNQYATALIRAGDPECAFRTVEHLILPSQETALSVDRTREPIPTSPLFHSPKPASSAAVLFGAAPQINTRRTKQRAHTRYRLRRSLPTWHVYKQDNGDDLAGPLHTLDRASATWTAGPQPRAATLKPLGTVLDSLRAGRLISPVSTFDGECVTGPVEHEEEARQAQEMLARIRLHSPRTVAAVERFAALDRDNYHSEIGISSASDRM